MNKNNIRSLHTIAAVRELAENMKNGGAEAARTADSVADRPGNLPKDLTKVLREEAGICATVAAELEAIADDAANYRAFATARFLVGPVALLTGEDYTATIDAIRSARAFIEHTAPLSVPHDSTCTVRLVPFHDADLDEERWAVHYTNTDGDEGISDNALQEDADWRYWQIAGPLGAVKPG